MYDRLAGVLDGADIMAKQENRQPDGGDIHRRSFVRNLQIDKYVVLAIQDLGQ